MSKLDGHIGCAGAVHILIALACWVGFFNAISSSQLKQVLGFGGLATLETILVLGIRYCITRRWVWYLGYICWFGLLIISLIPWVSMFLSPPLKDGMELGMTLVFLPLLVVFTAIPVAGLIQWIALQSEVFPHEANRNDVDEET